MKKLMLAVAIVCAAAIAQAATVQWQSAKLFTAASADGGFSTTGIGSKATGYFISLTASEYNTFATAYATSGDMSAVWDAYKDSLADMTGTKTAAMSSAVTIKTEANVGDTVYGAVIYTYTDANLDKDFYIANIATGTVGSDTGISISNLGTKFLGGTNPDSTGGWVAVPEPTSALMLLVGLAGLALKRKVA